MTPKTLLSGLQFCQATLCKLGSPTPLIRSGKTEQPTRLRGLALDFELRGAGG
jgi:hypothetical protein